MSQQITLTRNTASTFTNIIQNKQKIKLFFCRCAQINGDHVIVFLHSTHCFRFSMSSYHFTHISLLTKFHRALNSIKEKHVKYYRWKESKRWHLYQLHDSWTLKYENSSNSARGDEFVSLRVQYRGAESLSFWERGLWETLSLATIFLLLSGENGW